MNCNLIITAPFIEDFNFEKYPYDQKYIILKELQEVLPDVEFGRKEIFTVQESIIEIHKMSQYISEEEIREKYLRSEILVIAFVIEVDFNKYHDELKRLNENKFTEEEANNILPYSLYDTFAEKMYEVLLLSQIARPGSFKLQEGQVIINGKKYHETLRKIINFRNAMDFHAARKYPSIEFLNFGKFYNWIIQNKLGFTDNPTSTFQWTLNHITHLNIDPGQLNTFIYEVMMLEKIFDCDGHKIADQLNKKIQLLLGPIKTHKKQIKEMYNLRSRFVHGDISLNPIHIEDEWEADNKNEKFSIDQASDLSKLIILSTLQTMYENNCTDISYEYKLTMHNKGAR